MSPNTVTTTQRRQVLEGSGDNPDLLNLLLSDAQKWTDLRRLLQRQINGAMEFGAEYCRKYSEHSSYEELKKSLQDLRTTVGDQLSGLDKTSQNLVEIVRRPLSLSPLLMP